MRLLGRRAECEALDGLLADALAGRSRVAVLRGEAGAGKSALLDYVSERVAGWHVATAVGVESEMELAYSGLHQLCAPMLDHLDRLPAPQRDALATVFGLGHRPCPRSIPGRTRDADAVRRGRRAAAARLHRRRRAVARPGVGADPRVRRPPPPRRADRARVRSAHRHRRRRPRRAPGAADPRARRQRCTRAAARERARSARRRRLRTDRRGEPRQPARAARAAAHLERRGARRRVRVFPTATRSPARSNRATRGASSGSRPTRSCSSSPRPQSPSATPCCSTVPPRHLGIDMAAAEPAAGRRAAQASVGASSSRTRSSAPPPTARRPPRTAAGCIAPSPRPPTPRRTRTGGPGTAPAPPLGPTRRSPSSSNARPAVPRHVAASPPRLRSCSAPSELTADPARRTDSALAAAEASFQAGAFDSGAAPLGHGWIFRRSTGSSAARAALLRGHVAVVLGYGDDAAPLLLQAARQLEPFDLELARGAYLTAYGSALSAAHLGDAGVFLEICRAIEDLPPPQGAPDAKSLLLEGLARMHTDGRAVATPILQRAASALAQMPRGGRPPMGVDLRRWPVNATWDSDGSSAIFERQANIVRNAGALAELPMYLSALALDRTWNGDLADARLLIAESDAVAAATGSQLPPIAALRLLSMEGKEADASALIAATIEHATARGQGLAVSVAQWAASVLYNGLARYDEASAAARQVTANDIDPYPKMWALPELVEAAARVGRDRSRARGVRPSGRDDAAGRHRLGAWHAGSLAGLAQRRRGRRPSSTRTRSSGSAGPGCARSSPERTCCTASGCAARAGGVDAREQLRTAHNLFTAIGMEAFAERARARVARHRREGPQTQPRHARRPHRPGRADRPARPGRATRTRRSGRSSSSAHARSSGTCARCSRSSASAPAKSSTQHCSRKRGNCSPCRSSASADRRIPRM